MKKKKWEICFIYKNNNYNEKEREDIKSRVWNFVQLPLFVDFRLFHQELDEGLFEHFFLKHFF